VNYFAIVHNLDFLANLKKQVLIFNKHVFMTAIENGWFVFAFSETFLSLANLLLVSVGKKRRDATMVIIYDDQINRWRTKQRSKLNSFDLPNISDLVTSRPFSSRILNLLFGILLLVVIPGAFFFLTAILPKLGSGAPKVIAYVVFIAVVGSIVKASISQFSIAFSKSTIDERYWNAGNIFLQEGNLLSSLRCYAEALTYPWIKRPFPRGLT
jgi:hypothetical protein